MTSITSFRYLLLASIGLGLADAPSVRGCGPDFPNSYLSNSIGELSTLPALSFERELERLVGSAPRVVGSADEQAARALADERAEIRDALAQAGLGRREIDAELAGYRRDAPPAALPREFQLYAEGAKAWHEQRPDDAVRVWRELLALPPRERHYRTVWAAYMLGRALCDRDPGAAREACRLARDAATHGFADSQQLAAASGGWAARSWLVEENYVEALRGYLRQFALGDASSVVSLQQTLQRVFRGDPEEGVAEQTDHGDGCVESESAAPDDVLRALAGDRELRAVVTAWFAARGGPAAPWSEAAAGSFTRWLRALPAASDLSPVEAERWGWAAYQNGRWSEAAALIAHAPEDAPAAEWVRAMLLLRTGFVHDAARHLAIAARGFATDRALAEPPADEEDPWRPHAEQQPLRDAPAGQLGGVRGVLELRDERYTEALRIFLATRHWSDAAYVAERVLTLEELEAFVRAEVPEEATVPMAAAADFDLRHLLARRLVRAGRFDEAAPFFPSAIRPIYDRYVQAVRDGMDDARPVKARAAALWEAAKTMNEHGMEIQGTELAPDYAIWGGDFEWPNLADAAHTSRDVPDQAGDTGRWRAWMAGEIAAGADEGSRVMDNKVPSHRFHYRYRAAELGMMAAGLLPNDDEEAATILNTTGTWIARRDPELGEFFYKSLVVRCPNTNLGRRAAEKHWLIW